MKDDLNNLVTMFLIAASIIFLGANLAPRRPLYEKIEVTGAPPIYRQVQ